MLRVVTFWVAIALARQLAVAQNAHATLVQAREFIEAGQFDKASEILSRLVRSDPSNAEGQYDLGLIALRQSRPADALVRFEAVLRREPDNVSALTGALESQLLLKRHAAARSIAHRLANLLKPTDPRYYRTAGLLATNDEYAAAIPMLEKVRELSPANYEVNYNLALAYFRAAQLDSALRVIAPFGNTAEAADLRGAIEQRRGNIAGALQAYRTAGDLDPQNEDYRADLGAALLESGKAIEAVKLFRAGLEQAPESWRLRLGLGSALYVEGRYEDAAAALLEAAQRRPDASVIYVLLAKAYESAPALQSQIATAIESRVRQGDADASLHIAYGDLLYSKREFAGARLAYEKALRLDTKLADAHLRLGIALQAEGNSDRALREFQRAVKADPRLGAAHYRLGLAYRKVGRTREAQTELETFRKIKAQSGDEAGEIVRSLLAR